MKRGIFVAMIALIVENLALCAALLLYSPPPAPTVMPGVSALYGDIVPVPHRPAAGRPTAMGGW